MFVFLFLLPATTSPPASARNQATKRLTQTEEGKGQRISRTTLVGGQTLVGKKTAHKQEAHNASEAPGFFLVTATVIACVDHRRTEVGGTPTRARQRRTRPHPHPHLLLAYVFHTTSFGPIRLVGLVRLGLVWCPSIAAAASFSSSFSSSSSSRTHSLTCIFLSCPVTNDLHTTL